MLTLLGRLVTIVDYEVVSLYSDSRRVPAEKPDKQIIIYGKSAIEKGLPVPSLSWSVWLSQFKGYQKGLVEKDQWFYDLREILVHLFGEETVSKLESTNLKTMNAWGLGNGKD